MKTSHIILLLFTVSAIIAAVDAFNVGQTATSSDLLVDDATNELVTIAENDEFERPADDSNVPVESEHFEDGKTNKLIYVDQVANFSDEGVDDEDNATGYPRDNQSPNYTAVENYSTGRNARSQSRNISTAYNGGRNVAGNNALATATAAASSEQVSAQQTSSTSRAQRNSQANNQDANANVIYDEFGNRVDNNYDATGNVVKKFQCPKTVYMGGSAYGINMLKAKGCPRPENYTGVW